MTQPTVYTPNFEFEPLAPANVPDAGERLDAEFARIAEVFSEYRFNLALIQRDDGKPANNTVHPDALTARTRTLIGGGWNLRGQWTTATAYAAKDVVKEGGSLYVCLVPHTSGTFSTDLTAERWLTWYAENVTPGAGSITTSMLASTIIYDPLRIRAVAAPGVEKRIMVFDDAGVPTMENLTTTLQTLLDEVLPLGAIVAYEGDLLDLPATWAVCDGNNGTPDLRGLFVIGSNDSTFPAGSTGGASSVTTSSNGAHDHGGNTGGHALTAGQMPVHNHGFENVITGSGSLFLSGGTAWGKVTTNTSNAGNGETHSHSITSGGAHTHTATTLPPYYSLVYIMRIGNFAIPGAADLADAFFAFAASDETSALAVATEVATVRIPFAFVSIDEVRASLTNPSTSGVVTVNVKVNNTSLFSTNLTIDANETTSTTAAAPFVLSPGNHGPFADDAEVTVDIVGAGTGASGLKIYLIGKRAA